MKLKKFDDYLKKRLDKKEIAALERQATMEHELFTALQKDLSKTIETYMQEKNIGFNELVRRLESSPSQVAKIQNGEANLTLASLAHLGALMNKKPHIIFKEV